MRRRRKGDVVSYAENNTKGGVRTDLMAVKNPIKRTDVTTLLCYSCVPLHRPWTYVVCHQLDHNKIAHPPTLTRPKSQSSADTVRLLMGTILLSANSKKAKGGSPIQAHNHSKIGLCVCPPNAPFRCPPPKTWSTSPDHRSTTPTMSYRGN